MSPDVHQPDFETENSDEPHLKNIQPGYLCGLCELPYARIAFATGEHEINSFKSEKRTPDEADERRRYTHRRFEEFQSRNNGDGHGYRSSGWTKGTTLAPERGRVAVLHQWKGTNDNRGNRKQG